MANNTLTFLLAERRRFAGQKLDAAVASILGKADKLPDLGAGMQAQLERHVSVLPRRWPMAALTRQLDVGDAQHHAWLRADPAHVRAEMGVVRLLACGDVGLSAPEAEQLTKPLKILFGDLGFLLSAPNPARWYLMLPKESHLPLFKSPDEAIGADIFSLLPAGDVAKRWHVLLNEAQITLHNHPLNAERVQKGLLPVNSLYFWGGGVLPDQVKFHADRVISDDLNMQSLMRQADTNMQEPAASVLVDRRHLRDWSSFERDHLIPAMKEMQMGKYASVILDFSDGAIHEISPSQKWRFWRSNMRELA